MKIAGLQEGKRVVYPGSVRPRMNPEAPSLGLGEAKLERGGQAKRGEATRVDSFPGSRLTYYKWLTTLTTLDTEA